jgi:hypothetical protein
MSIEQEQTSKVTTELERKLAYNARFTHMEKSPSATLIKNELKKYGANATDLKIIDYLAKLMLDRSSFIDKLEPKGEVSSVFLELHKRPKKLEKILKRIGVYTLVAFTDKRTNADEDNDGTVPVDSHEVLTFIGKTPDNRILMTEFPNHKQYKAIPDEIWCGLALLRFAEQIQSYQILEMMGNEKEDSKINEGVIQDLLKGTGTTFKLSEEELAELKQHMPEFTDEPITVSDLVDQIDDAEFTELV